MIEIDTRRRVKQSPPKEFWAAWTLVGWLTAASIFASIVLGAAYFVWLTEQQRRYEAEIRREATKFSAAMERIGR